MFGERKRDTYTQRERTTKGNDRVRGGGGDLISYASADHTASGTVKSPAQNTTLNNELYVHDNLLLFRFDIHMKKNGVKNKK